MSEYNQVRYWVEALPKMGIYTFSLSDAINQFSNKPSIQVKNALNRLVRAKRIASVWRGFYAINLPEYGFKGIIPPTEYIDHLMKYLKKDYYIATLSAAALHGASHQKPQIFTFVSNQIMHPKEKNETRLEPLLRKRIPHKYIERKNVRSGTINISMPLLTALDLILYPTKSGGISNVATIIAELSENIDLDIIDNDFFHYAPISAFQRLGYVLDEILDEHDLSMHLLEKANKASVVFRKTPLVTYNNISCVGLQYNKKWKIVVNEEVDTEI